VKSNNQKPSGEEKAINNLQTLADRYGWDATVEPAQGGSDRSIRLVPENWDDFDAVLSGSNVSEDPEESPALVIETEDGDATALRTGARWVSMPLKQLFSPYSVCIFSGHPATDDGSLNVFIGLNDLFELECAIHRYEDERSTTITALPSDGPEEYVEGLPEQEWTWKVDDPHHPMVHDFERAGVELLTGS